MLLQADEAEKLILDSILDRLPQSPNGELTHTVKRYTWGEGVDGSAGQRYAVQVVVRPSDTVGARIECRPLVCFTAQRDALKGDDHTHDDTTCDWGMAPDVHRGWGYLSLEQALLAALRWTPDVDPEPFGWTRAFDGSKRIRPHGDPAREIIGE